jgi:hypothetical protein
VDRDAMVRSQRRRQVEALLTDERGRETVLAERLEEVVAEADGARLDERIFAQLDPEDVGLVREVLQPQPVFDDDDEGLVDASGEPSADSWEEEEIVRLQHELADSRRRQRAYERYLEALDS